jgi:CBS domain-containing protein/CheY-like chemotaxis protein
MPTTVGDLMTRSVHTIFPETRIGQAIHLMTQHGITSLPVVSAQGRFLGLISDSQLLPLVVRPDLANDFVGDHMVRDVATTTVDAPIADLVAELVERKIRRLPVIEDGHLVGLISRTHLMRHIRNQMKSESSRAELGAQADTRLRIRFVTSDTVSEILYQRLVELAFGDFVEVAFSGDLAAAAEDLRVEHADLILAEVDESPEEGLALVAIAKDHNPCTQVILIGNQMDWDYTSRAMQSGAAHYLVKPIDHQDLVELIQEAIGRWRRWAKVATCAIMA